MTNQIHAFGKLCSVDREHRFRFSIRKRPDYLSDDLNWSAEVKLLETTDGQYIMVVKNLLDMLRVWLHEYARHDPAGLAEEAGDVMPLLISAGMDMAYPPEVARRVRDFFLQKFEDHEDHGGTYILLGQYSKYMVDKWQEWR